MCWYVAEGYTRLLKTKEQPVPQRVLDGLASLVEFLMSEVRLIEGNTNGAGDAGKKDAKDMVPSDRVKDPGALARELRWRVRVAINGESGDEGGTRLKGYTASKHKPAAGQKRKRGNSDKERLTREGSPASESQSDTSRMMFKNFTPRPWDAVKTTEAQTLRLEGEAPPLLESVDVEMEDDRPVGALERRTSSVVKVRRIGDGSVVEREVVTRVREVWKADSLKGS